MHLLTLLLVMLFALVIAYFCYSVYFYGGRWVANPYNPRISSQKQHVIMGTLTDRDGTVLAYTDEDGQRRYNNSADTRKAVCQVIGDSGGKVSTGADTFHAQFLLGFRSSIFERLADAFTGTTQRGDDVRLTISERLSRYISEQFPKGKRGAVVVLNYKTNEILAMVSMPQFDPTNMDAALANESAGALINRATQGLYPPGSTFKIVTMASALENLPDLYANRMQALAEVELLEDFLSGRVHTAPDGEEWTLRKLLRRFLWHDRIHARAMWRTATALWGDSVANPFFFV